MDSDSAPPVFGLAWQPMSGKIASIAAPITARLAAFGGLLWGHTLYALLAIIATALAALAALLFAPLLGAERGGRWITRPWALLLTAALPVRVHIRGAWPIAPAGAIVVAANHQSQFDVPVLYRWLNRDLRWVMKQEVMNIPLVGRGAVALGHIAIDRNAGPEARRRIEEKLATFNPGVGLLFFAEGTRSRDGRVLPFKSGAFRIAIEQGLPLVPVAISGTRRVFPPGAFGLRPGEVTITIHPPIETAGLGEDDIKPLRDRVQHWIAAQVVPDAGQGDAG